MKTASSSRDGCAVPPRTDPWDSRRRLRECPPRWRGALAEGAREKYIKDRCNGKSQPDVSVLPGDGEITWIKGRVDGEWVYGIERHVGMYDIEVQYTEGPRDKAFMEAKDREYLTQIAKDEPAKFLQEMDSLQLDLPHHQNLKREYGDIEARLRSGQHRRPQEEPPRRRPRAAAEPPAAAAAAPAPRPSPAAAPQPTHPLALPAGLQIPFAALTFDRERDDIGVGRFGVVYRAQWQRSTVAVKQLQLQRLSDRELAAFRHEAEMMRSLHHPNIIHLFGICTERGRYALVMEYMVLGSLYDVLHGERELPWPIRYRIAMDIVAGLAHLHEREIIHRDLKSLNVLLDDRMRAKVSDFGLAKLKTATTTATVLATRPGAAVQAAGTIPWMAPELHSLRPRYGRASDIYALAIVFWELATRGIPFEGVEAAMLIACISRGDREEIPETCPPEFAALIVQCWDQEPRARPTAVAIAEWLQPLIPEEPAAAAAPARPAADSLMSDGAPLRLSALRTTFVSAGGAAGGLPSHDGGAAAAAPRRWFL